MDKDIPLKKANTINRTNIVLVSGTEEERKENYSEYRYLSKLENDYCNQHIEHIPYHYFCNKSLDIFYVKPTLFRTDIDIFAGLSDDIFILLEGGLDSITDENASLLGKHIYDICIINGISPKNIIAFPEHLNPNFIKGNGLAALEKYVSDMDEQANLASFVSARAKEKEGISSQINSISFKPPLSIEDLSEITNVDVDTLSEINKLNPPVLATSISSAIITTTSALVPKAKSVYFGTAKDAKKISISATAFSKQSVPSVVKTQGGKVVSVFANSINKPLGNNIGAPSISGMSTKSGVEEEKPFPIDVTLRNALPGYKNAYFEFTDLDTKEVKVVGFMISPNSFSEARSNNANLVRTKSGWFSARMGRNPVNLSLTGYMLDTKECQERHNFIQNFYKEYIEDKKTESGDHYNRYAVSLIIEGKKYIGTLNSLSVQKSATQQFLYQYSMAFTSFDEVMVFEGMSGTTKVKSAGTVTKSSGQVGKTIASGVSSSGRTSETKNSGVVGPSMWEIISPGGKASASEIFNNLYKFKQGLAKV